MDLHGPSRTVKPPSVRAEGAVGGAGKAKGKGTGRRGGPSSQVRGAVEGLYGRGFVAYGSTIAYR